MVVHNHDCVIDAIEPLTIACLLCSLICRYIAGLQNKAPPFSSSSTQRGFPPKYLQFMPTEQSWSTGALSSHVQTSPLHNSKIFSLDNLSRVWCPQRGGFNASRELGTRSGIPAVKNPSMGSGRRDGGDGQDPEQKLCTACK